MHTEELKNKNPRLRGKVEGLSGRNLNGWLWDESVPEARITFEVYVDGRSVASDIADTHRADLAKAGIGNGEHAFTVLLPGSLFDGKKHNILVQEAGTTRQIAPLKDVFFDSELRPEYVSKVESVDEGFIRGYVYNTRDTSAQIGVALCVDGREIAVAIADRPSSNKLAPYCSFEISLNEFDIGDFAHNNIVLVTIPDREVIASELNLIKELARLTLQAVQDMVLINIDLTLTPRNGAIFDILVDDVLQVQLSCSAQNPLRRLVGHLPLKTLSDGVHSIAARLTGTKFHIGSSPLIFGRKSNLVANSSFARWNGAKPDKWFLTLPEGAIVEPCYTVEPIVAHPSAPDTGMSIKAEAPLYLKGTIIAQNISVAEFDILDVIIIASADERTNLLVTVAPISSEPGKTEPDAAKDVIEQKIAVWPSWSLRRISFRLPNELKSSSLRLSIIFEDSQISRVSIRLVAAGAQGIEYENANKFGELLATDAVLNGAMEYWSGSLRKTARLNITELAENWSLTCKTPDLGVEARLTELMTRDPKRGSRGLLAHAIALKGTISNKYIRLETRLDALQLAAAPPQQLSFYAKSGIGNKYQADLYNNATTIAEIMVIERRASKIVSANNSEKSRYSDERMCQIANRLRVRSIGEMFSIKLDLLSAVLIQQRVQANINQPDVSYFLVFQFSDYVDIALTKVSFGKTKQAASDIEEDGFIKIEDPNIIAQVGRVKGISHWNETRVLAASALSEDATFKGSRRYTRWAWPVSALRSVDIIICVHNALNETLECLESIRRCTNIPYTVTIVDDASEPLVSDRLSFIIRDLPWMRILNTENNVGYTRAANIGLSSSNADWVVLLNSDTIVTPNWLQGLFEVVDANPKVAMVGPLSNAASWQTVPDIYDVQNQWKVNMLPEQVTVDEIAGLVRELSERRFPTVPLLNGFCTLMKKSVVEDVGLFDENAFPQGYGEENDLCLRVGQAGYQLAIADHVYVYHSKSASFGRERRDNLSKQGTVSFKAKHPNIDLSEITRSFSEEISLTEMRLKLRTRLAELAVCSAPSYTRTSS